MFTGLVASQGQVVSLELEGGAMLRVRSRLAAQLERGDSVAVNGVCLTARDVADSEFSADLSEETLTRSALGNLEPGAVVNLELAARVGDRLGGHMVQGHVDAVAEVSAASDSGPGRELTFRAPRELSRYVVEKGSVAVDGVSLTVTEVSGDEFSVSVIPETLDRTNLAHAQVGDRVNLEVDLIAKYVEKLVATDG